MIIAATGHRPDKLGGYSRPVLQHLVSNAARYLEKQKPTSVISGMAQGWDTAWAIAALDFDIPLTCALPFNGQHLKWPPESQQLWSYIVARAKHVHVVAGTGYAPWKMFERNKWMIDHCDKVCALWNGSAGGTSNCVAYANKKNKPVDNIWNEFAAVRS